MSVRINEFLKCYAFIEGILIGILICSWGYEQFRLSGIKDDSQSLKLRNEFLKEDLDKSKKYEKKYLKAEGEIQQQVEKIHNLRAELNHTKSDLSNRLSMKWKEKFEVQMIRNDAISAKLADTEKRINQLKSGNTANTKDQNELKAKLVAVESERDKLRLLYTTSSSHILSNKQPPAIVTNSSSELLLASLDGLSVIDIGDYLINKIPTVNGGVPSSIFIKMLEKASVIDRGSVAKNVLNT